MKIAILLLPTLLTIGFIAAASTQTTPTQTLSVGADRAAQIRQLHQALNDISERLSAVESTPRNFAPRGIAAVSPTLLATASVASPATHLRQP
jgi:hypothetical protein